MPTIKQAQTPPENRKDMTSVSSGAAMNRPAAPAVQSERTGLNQLAIGPVPSILGTVYDTVRQWIRPGTPQFRTFPLPVKNNQQVTSIVKSVIETSVSTSGGTPGTTPSGTFLPLAGGTLSGPLVFAPTAAPFAINSQTASPSQFTGPVSVSGLLSAGAVTVAPGSLVGITFLPSPSTPAIEIGGRDVSNIGWLWQIQFSGYALFTTVESTNGFRIGGAAPTGHVLRGNGVNYVDAVLAVADLANGARPGFQQFTSSGTFTIPAGVTAAKATVVGAGGAGGGSDGTHTGAGGGGGGSAIKWLSGLTPGNTIVVTVGTGGVGVSAGTGGNGTSSSISSGTQSITTVTGLYGSGGSAAATAPNGGGVAGGASNGDINLSGTAADILLGLTVGVNGGGSALFASRAGVAIGSTGALASNPGGGGGGAQGAGPFAGGNGANGIVIFEWIY